MLRDLAINALCLLSIVGGSAATALSIPPEAAKVQPVAMMAREREVAAIKPEQLVTWSTAIANAIPVVAASLLLVWSNYRATKRRIEAEDAAAQSPQPSPLQGQEGPTSQEQ